MGSTTPDYIADINFESSPPQLICIEIRLDRIKHGSFFVVLLFLVVGVSPLKALLLPGSHSVQYQVPTPVLLPMILLYSLLHAPQISIVDVGETLEILCR